MHENRIYKTFVYLAGIKTPFISASVSSQYGSLANLNLEIPYSPYITHIHEYTKVQLWEQIIDDGSVKEPTLEFDGVVVGIVRNKNVLGNVSVRLTCLTDGVIWNQRKQYDFYIDQITQADGREIDDLMNLRADGAIDNYIHGLLESNKFDIGCAVASVLTSQTLGEFDANDKATQKQMHRTSFTYLYNGKKFKKQLVEAKNNPQNVNPTYYDKFLKKYKLSNKIYGISTSANVKDFFQQDRFIELVTNQSNDLVGENTFWTIATTVMQYGFYSIYNIPNPTYIPKTKDVKSTDIDLALLEEGETQVDLITPRKENTYNGLAEFILKPISVLGLPLKCNIIWPEQVISESLFFDLINSPTRITMQMSPLPADDKLNVLLTTKKVVGPAVASGDFFSSYVPASVKRHMDGDKKVENPKIRPDTIYSDYEAEYGMRYTQLQLSYAFENSLLKDNEKKDPESIKAKTNKINNFLNYEFAQRFFSSRNYSVQVTPDVDVVPGLPVIVLNKNAEHVICFCTGKTKSWDNRGSKSVGITVGYPRFYYENIDQLGNIVDPTCKETPALQELELLFGSEALVRTDNNKEPLPNVNSTKLIDVINKLFINYQTGKIEDMYKYQRKVCTYNNFMEFYGQDKTTSMPGSYLLEEFKSSKEADKLTCHGFAVNGGDVKYLTNHAIIQNHLDWTSEAQRI